MLNAIHERELNVLPEVKNALYRVCTSTSTLSLDRNGFGGKEPRHPLREIVIDADICDIHLLKIFTKHMSQFIGEQYLKSRVIAHIYGEIGKHQLPFYNAFSICKQVNVYISTIFFGVFHENPLPAHTALQNPDLTEFILPLSHLKLIVIDTETYTFHHVERFLTYALNHLGRQYIAQKLNVHIHGIPEKLHPNLLNNLAPLCCRVSVLQDDNK